jgi:GrpB-like predicted nucleotidyltransferase (UPF0157 family)
VVGKIETMFADKMKKRPYSIQSYNPEWVLKFEKIKIMLEQVFSSQAMAIEHVGSTSIPGMKAKPLIDILVIVEKMAPFVSEREQMSELGYQNIDNYISPNSIVFFKTDNEDRKLENIHVCVKDSYKVRQFLLMRDYLRAHSNRAKEYSELKEKLSTKFPGDYPSYRAGKKDFLDGIEKEAEKWNKSSL